MNLVTGSLKLSNFLTLPGEIYKSTQLLVQLLQEKKSINQNAVTLLREQFMKRKVKKELISCLFPWGKMVITILAMNLSGDVVPIALLQWIDDNGFSLLCVSIKK